MFLIAGKGNGQNGTQAGQTITDCCAHRDLSPSHLGSSCCTRRVDCVLSRQGEGTTARRRRGGLCVHDIDAWCSLEVKDDGQSFPHVDLLKQRCRPHYRHHLVAAVYFHPDADWKDALYIYNCMFCNFCHMRVFTDFHFFLYNPGL